MKMSVYHCPSCSDFWTSKTLHFPDAKHGCEISKIKPEAYPSEGERATVGLLKLPHMVEHAASELIGNFVVDDMFLKYEPERARMVIGASIDKLVQQWKIRVPFNK